MNRLKPNIRQNRVILSVWWNFKDIFFKLLPDNRTITSEVYYHQLDKLNYSLKLKRPELMNRNGVVLPQDNTRPHTSLVTCQKLLQHGWDILPHPPYSSVLAPFDYYLFRSLKNFLNGDAFTSNKEIKIRFLPTKNKKFYEREIMLLRERWQKKKRTELLPEQRNTSSFLYCTLLLIHILYDTYIYEKLSTFIKRRSILYDYRSFHIVYVLNSCSPTTV
nr:PREDICTED: histone-lysine N-methyltransferase SETMAR-like [Megachile rotundata]